jgi:hypothetical protein
MQRCVRKANIGDAIRLAPKLRLEDVWEIKSSHNVTALEGLLYPFSQKNHKTYAIIGDEEEGTIGMFGVVPSEDKEYGVAWLLSSLELMNHIKQFLKECPYWIEEMEKDYKYLFNYVHEKNKMSIRWLKHFGFKYISEGAYGVRGDNFYYMLKEKENEIKNTIK